MVLCRGKMGEKPSSQRFSLQLFLLASFISSVMTPEGGSLFPQSDSDVEMCLCEMKNLPKSAEPMASNFLILSSWP